MTFEPIYLLYALFGYLVGSISTAIITCKFMRLDDPRSVGSNNPGATNVLRHGGKKAAIITLLGDMLKGFIPAFAVTQLQPESIAIALAGFGAFIGHLYPLYFRFKGGKGVATFYGVLLGFSAMTGLVALLVWLAMAALFRISSLAALVSALSAPVIIWYFHGSEVLIATGTLMTLLIYWKHRSNIRDLLQGKEEKIAAKED